MGLLTLSTNSGTATATSYSTLASATSLWFRLRLAGAKIKNAGGGTGILSINNGTNNKLLVQAFADGTDRAVYVSFRDGSGEVFNEMAVANTSLADASYYIVSGFYNAAAGGQTQAFIHDSSNTQLVASSLQERESTLVTTGYTNLALLRNNVSMTVDGVAFWNANPGGNPNDEPTNVGSILGYYAFASNGNNEVSGAPAISLGGSSPTDYSFAAGGEWDPWSSGSVRGTVFRTPMWGGQPQ